jgi:predicted nucleic acid-binding Zn ribbon protein
VGRAYDRPGSFVPGKEGEMEFEDQDISEFIAGCAKQFCPWCGSPVIPNRMGRKKKFCSDKCRWAFWKFETRHRDVKTEMEARLNENRRAVHD